MPKIRPARPADYPEIAALFPALEEDEPRPTEADFHASLHQKTLVLTTDPSDPRKPSVIGYALFEPSRPRALLRQLAIAKDHQRQGLGRLLLEATRKSLIAAGCTRLTLNVHAHNTPALRLYASLGLSPLIRSKLLHLPAPCLAALNPAAPLFPAAPLPALTTTPTLAPTPARNRSTASCATTLKPLPVAHEAAIAAAHHLPPTLFATARALPGRELLGLYATSATATATATANANALATGTGTARAPTNSTASALATNAASATATTAAPARTPAKTDLTAPEIPLACTVFHPSTAAAYPFRTHSTEAGLALLAQLSARLEIPTSPLKLVLEGQDDLVAHLLSLGAHLAQEVLHLEGPLTPQASDAAVAR